MNEKVIETLESIQECMKVMNKHIQEQDKHILHLMDCITRLANVVKDKQGEQILFKDN